MLTSLYCLGISIVAPYIGAWIEIILEKLFNTYTFVAPYIGAWIEIFVYIPSNCLGWSLLT